MTNRKKTKHAVYTARRRRRADLFGAWNFSETEWSLILDAIQSLHKQSLPTSTTEQAREFIVAAARRFKSELVRGTSIGRQRQLAKNWRAISSHAKKLARLLQVVREERHGDSFSDLGRAIEILGWMGAENADDLEGKWEFEVFTKKEIYTPRIMYLFTALKIWTACGGKLRFSREPITGSISGPLARYVRAVTQPVMGADSPSLESLREIILRHKAMCERWQRYTATNSKLALISRGPLERN